ncbi:MAG: thioredoxin [Alphaproteobacteria bacterium]
MASVKVTDDSFNADVIGSNTPVLVDFWAGYCAPCKQIAPALEEISDEFDGKMKVAKINIEEDPEIAAKFHVRGIPTMMIFKDGQVVATKVGAMTKRKLAEWVGEHA